MQEVYLGRESIWQVEVYMQDSWVWKSSMRTRDILMQIHRESWWSAPGDVFSVKRCYVAIVQHDLKVGWWRLAWVGNVFPRHGFIL